jgi:hypothetical protein
MSFSIRNPPGTIIKLKIIFIRAAGMKQNDVTYELGMSHVSGIK